MGHSALGLVIGLFSTALHGVLLVFCVSNLVQLPNLLKKDASYVGDVTSCRWLIFLDILFFVLEIALCTASILLIIGIKKERPRFVAPWIYLSAIFVVVHVLDLMRYSKHLQYHYADLTVIIKVSPIVLITILWYPIFCLWRKLTALLRSTHPQGKSKSRTNQNAKTTAPGADNDYRSPMLYPNLEKDIQRPADEHVPQETQTLYPKLP